jgi:hypothetical protein
VHLHLQNVALVPSSLAEVIELQPWGPSAGPVFRNGRGDGSERLRARVALYVALTVEKPTPRTKKPAVSSGFLRLRGRDSNPNFLIQSQASYH